MLFLMKSPLSPPPYPSPINASVFFWVIIKKCGNYQILLHVLQMANLYLTLADFVHQEIDRREMRMESLFPALETVLALKSHPLY